MTLISDSPINDNIPFHTFNFDIFFSFLRIHKIQTPFNKIKQIITKQGRKRSLETPKRMIERRRERKVEGEI